MRTSAYKRPQGKGSPAVSYYPKGMLVRGGGKGRDGGFARARGGGGGGARSALKSRGPEAVPPAPGFLFGGQGAGGPLASQTPPPPPRAPRASAAKGTANARPHALWGRAAQTERGKGRGRVAFPWAKPGPTA